MTASGSPFTNSTTSGRRVCWPSATVNWLTASQSLLSGASKSITRACAPAIEPSGAAVLDRRRRPRSIRWTARLRSTSDGASTRVSLRNASSSASAGSSGIQRDQRLAQAALQDHVAVVRVRPLRARARRRRSRALKHRVAEALQPREGSVFDDGFGERAQSLTQCSTGRDRNSSSAMPSPPTSSVRARPEAPPRTPPSRAAPRGARPLFTSMAVSRAARPHDEVHLAVAVAPVEQLADARRRGVRQVRADRRLDQPPPELADPRAPPRA